jgi:OFA family oxalate/formate antiporter-like MFS transporter
MGKIFYGWWIVLACFLVAFYIGGVVFYSFTAFFEPIVKEFGWSYTQVSLALSLRGLEMGILAPIVGFLVDHFGSRKLSFFGVLITGFGLILLSLTNSLVMFYIALLLLALGAGSCASTVLMTAIAHWFKKNVGRAMGIAVCGFGAGGILIPIIVWLIDFYQWRTALVMLGLGMWALGIPLSFVIRHRPEQYGYLPDGKIPAEPILSHGDRHREKGHLKEVLKGKNFWKVAVAEAIRLMIAMAIITHVMPYLGSIGMSRSSAAFVATSIPLFSIIGRAGFGWLSDIFDKRYVLAGTYCLLGIGTVAFAYIYVTWLIFPFLLMFSPALGAALPLRGAVVREYFGRASFGSLLGAMNGIGAIGGIIGPFVAGWTFDNLMSYRPIWLTLAGTTFIAVVLILRIKPNYQISEDREGG